MTCLTFNSNQTLEQWIYLTTKSAYFPVLNTTLFCPRYMYWTSSSFSSNGHAWEPRIEKSAMDGSNRSIITNLTADPIGLAHDRETNRLYWVEKDSRLIQYLNLDDPLNHVKVIDDQLRGQPISVTILGKFIYWTYLESGSWSGGVYRADKNTGAGITKVISLLGDPLDIHAYNTSRSTEAGKTQLKAKPSDFCCSIVATHARVS